ncbi:phage portal protein [Rhodothalassium salexigens]|uniref:phage portal protein n=1 Tax=Rhodothalassium salexigens TaxID=1086 RepID=UPI001914645A|nr:phage portal protein [Rhodothalassium salexigens]MBK5910144.1 phage portal protein [Rhodothalassium salexigens]MBK5920766.1 phage portal protein [Rhodothalassium salexigens]
MDHGAAGPGHCEAFTFGDPTPVLDRCEVASYFHAAWNGRFYEPPISLDGLARLLPSNPHHQSAITVKANILSSCFRPTDLVSRQTFKRLALDYLVFGNAYAELIANRLGQPMAIRPIPARWTRCDRDGGFVMLIDGREQPITGRVAHLMEPDISQEIYGMPPYTGAVQSALLNEAATLFRRKYYVNGSHAGFILYMTDPAQSQDDIDRLREAMREAKGPGNFRNLFMYAPNGKADGLKVIPIAEVAAKDEFLSLKNVSRDDVMAAHRVPPQLMGVIPNNTGGFGDADKAARVFAANELRPLMETFKDLNAWAGAPAVRFDDYTVG